MTFLLLVELWNRVGPSRMEARQNLTILMKIHSALCTSVLSVFKELLVFQSGVSNLAAVIVARREYKITAFFSSKQVFF
jgi:hypothetical protein